MSARANSETKVTEPTSFATPAEAEEYLMKTLPDAVAANPKYRSKDTGVLTRWVLHSIAFGEARDGSVEVSTDESFDEYRPGKMEPGTHHARFAIDEVKIESEVSVHDVTESGQDALGVMFRCKEAACIHAQWNGDPSMSAWTDIYIQDARHARTRPRRIPGAEKPRSINPPEDLLALTSLIACLHLDRPNGAVLAVSRDLAARFDATVIGVAAKQANMHITARAVGPVEPHEHEVRKFRDCAGAAEQEFRGALPETTNLGWRAQLTFGPAADFVAHEARAADLIVISTEPRDHLIFPSGCPEPGDLLMRLGRPILAVPGSLAGFNFGSALVCWKDSREARRAVSDALPLLRAMQRVDVVEIIEPRQSGEARQSLSELGEWLRRHGIEANCSTKSPRGPEAEQLRGIASDIGVDLIVAGAFGHSRLREWAFGGVTRDLVLSADRCVLASH